TRLRFGIAVSVGLVVFLWLAMYVMVDTTRRNDIRIEEELAKSQGISDAMASLQQLNGPGNDVLESWDHATERANLNRYQEDFNHTDRQLEGRFMSDPDLMAKYDDAKADIRTMIAHAVTVLDAAQRKDEAEKEGDNGKAQEETRVAAEKMA